MPETVQYGMKERTICRSERQQANALPLIPFVSVAKVGAKTAERVPPVDAALELRGQHEGLYQDHSNISGVH